MVVNFWEDTSRNYESPFAALLQAEFHRPNDEGVTATTLPQISNGTCCCSLTESSLTCDTMDCSTPATSPSTIFWSWLKFMSIESVMPFKHLNLLWPLSPPAFNLSQHQSFFPVNRLLASVAKLLELQHQSFQWTDLELISFRTDWFDLLGFQGTLKSSPVLHLIALSLVYGPTLTSVHDYWKKSQLRLLDLCQQRNVSAFEYTVHVVIAFLPKSKLLLISWMQSLSAVILEPKKIKSVTVSTFSPSICQEEMGLDIISLVS